MRQSPSHLLWTACRVPGHSCIYTYTHLQAQQYLIVKMDLQGHVAHARPTKVNYYTSGRNRTDINITKARVQAYALSYCLGRSLTLHPLHMQPAACVCACMMIVVCAVR
jgi:hypothetical protein